MNRIARKHWTSWDQVDPPRSFPGSPYQPAAPGQALIWDDPWYQEWQVFRQHIIALHYDELSQWANEAGIPRDRIFSAEGFIAPDPGQSPFAVRITSHGQNYDTSGVSIEGSIPRAGHLGAVLYGETAENQAPMEVPHSLFATFARMDPGWAVVETNATNLKKPLQQPHYAQSYHAFRDMFNFDAQEVSVMAWNGSNGLYSAASRLPAVHGVAQYAGRRRDARLHGHPRQPASRRAALDVWRAGLPRRRRVAA